MRLIMAGAGGRMGARWSGDGEAPGLGASWCDQPRPPFLAGVSARLPASPTASADQRVSRCRTRSPTASSISPFRPRPSPMSPSPPQSKLVHVIGTTGLSPTDEAGDPAAATHAVMVKSGNMSLGVNLLAALVKRVAQGAG